MSEPRSFASLSPGLLARKGAAKPVMHHQLNALLGVEGGAAVDAGQALHEAEIVDIGSRVAPPSVPEVVRQQRGIAARVGGKATVRRSALAEGRNAAFTLRLDAERHLKLRMACTLEHRSAQQIVTEALDKLLSTLPEAADLASRAGKRR